MAATAKFYGLFFKSLSNKEIDLDSDTLKLMLVTSSYTPDQDTHQYKSSVTNECSGTGYTAGGATVGSISVSYNTGTNVLSFDGTDGAWTGLTLSTPARYGILYDSSPASDATRPLIGYVDFGADQAMSGGNLTVAWDSSGIGAVTVS